MSNPATVVDPLPPSLPPWPLPALASPWSYVLMAAVILALDVLTGPFLMFPILFVIPVTLSAWFYSARWAFALAILLPAGRFIIAAIWEQSSPVGFLIANAFIRVLVLAFLAFLVGRTAQQTKELQREVNTLEGILHICMFCKRIRDERAGWEPLEAYICQHSEADFSHGLCPECAQKHYGDVLAKRRSA